MDDETTEKEELLPDYSVDVNFLCFDYELLKTMYYVDSFRASVLDEQGFKIYMLEKRNTTYVKPYSIKKGHVFSEDNFYVIKQEEWRNFLNTEQGIRFVEQWLSVSNCTYELLHKKPVNEGSLIYKYYELVFLEEASLCKTFLKEKGNQKEETDAVSRKFFDICDYGESLAFEYAERLCYIEKALGREDANEIRGYMEIMVMQYNHLIDEFYKTIQHKEGTK